MARTHFAACVAPSGRTRREKARGSATQGVCQGTRLARSESMVTAPTTPARDKVRIAAVGDLHFGRTASGTVQTLLAEAAAAADVLVLCGDLTDYGQLEEARALGREIAQHAKVPVIAVLGNHDYESGQAAEVR